MRLRHCDERGDVAVAASRLRLLHCVRNDGSAHSNVPFPLKPPIKAYLKKSNKPDSAATLAHDDVCRARK